MHDPDITNLRAAVHRTRGELREARADLLVVARSIPEEPTGEDLRQLSERLAACLHRVEDGLSLMDALLHKARTEH